MMDCKNCGSNLLSGHKPFDPKPSICPICGMPRWEAELRADYDDMCKEVKRLREALENIANGKVPLEFNLYTSGYARHVLGVSDGDL